MTVYCFSNSGKTALPGATALTDPGKLPTAYTMVGGNSYLFKSGEVHNLADTLLILSYTASPITIGAWGVGARPILTRFRTLSASECVEVDATGGTTTPQSGTNLWKVPRQFFGLYEGQIWGARTDITGATNGNAALPAAPREWAYADSDTSVVVYSVGNPVLTYGGLYANNVKTTDYATAYKRAAIYFVQPGGQVTITGLSFRTMQFVLRFSCGTGRGVLPGPLIELCDFRNVRTPITFVGDSVAAYTGTGFTGTTIRSVYAENLGQALTTSSNVVNGGGICMNKLLISDFVINGCGKAESAGGIYLDHLYTNDGDRMIVERGTISGQTAFNFWPADGYAFYQENGTSDLEFRYCFGWNNSMNYHSNSPRGNNVFRNCVAYAKAGVSASYDMFHIGGTSASADVTLIGCTAIGFRRFCGSTWGASGLYRIINNTSMSNGDPGGASNSNALRCANYAAASVYATGNNFYGHDYLLYDGALAADQSAAVLNTNYANPAEKIAKLPIPTDPTVNYSWAIPPSL